MGAAGNRNRKNNESENGEKETIMSKKATVWIAIGTFLLGIACGVTPMAAQYHKLDQNFVTMSRTCNAKNND
jgi:hypothetical protein